MKKETGCKYCDEGLIQTKLRHCYIHYIDYRCMPCNNDTLLTNRVRDSNMPHKHKINVLLLHGGKGGELPSWGTNTLTDEITSS